jgi:hypothetical protein
MWGSGVENIENKNKREVDWESATGPRIHIYRQKLVIMEWKRREVPARKTSPGSLP